MLGLMTTAELIQYLSVGRTYIHERRSRGDWVMGTHWFYLSPTNPRKGIRYQPELCLNWMLNRDQPEQHQEFVKTYMTKHRPSAV